MAGKNDHRRRSYRNPLMNASSTFLYIIFFLVKNTFTIGFLLVVFFCLLSSSLSQMSSDSLVSSPVSLKFSHADRRYEIFSPSLMVGNRWKSTLWTMRMNFWTDFTMESENKSSGFAAWPDLRTDFSVFTYPGLDYRGTTYYLPENVKEYIDYKMGRERYLPVANPIVLGYLFYYLQKFWPPIAAENSNASPLNDLEMKLLQILLEKNPLDEGQWYQLVTADTFITLSVFRIARDHLIRQSLVIQQLVHDNAINYVPSTTAPSFYIRRRH